MLAVMEVMFERVAGLDIDRSLVAVWRDKNRVRGTECVGARR